MWIQLPAYLGSPGAGQGWTQSSQRSWVRPRPLEPCGVGHVGITAVPPAVLCASCCPVGAGEYGTFILCIC